jgi:hypothetical protein
MHLKPLCILSTIILFFTACSTECDNAQEYPLQNLSSYVPYTGYDTLRFLHNSTDTQVFIGEGINYFWVRMPAEDDTQCPKDMQSVSVRFKNISTNDELKLEYVYDKIEFVNTLSINSKVDFKFYFNNARFGIEQPSIRTSNPVAIGGKTYTYVTYFANSIDTPTYLAYKVPSQFLIDGGILKFKLSFNEVYEIIK